MTNTEEATSVITVQDFPRICRICLQKGQLVPIFHSSILHGNTLKVDWLLKECAKLEVTKNDSLPKSICLTCLMQLMEIHNFQRKCYLNDLTLKIFVKSLCENRSDNIAPVVNSTETVEDVDIKIEESEDGQVISLFESEQVLDDRNDLVEESLVQEIVEESSVQETVEESSVQEIVGESSLQEIVEESSVQEIVEESSLQEVVEESLVQDDQTIDLTEETVEDFPLQHHSANSEAVFQEIPDYVDEAVAEFPIEEDQSDSVGCEPSLGDRNEAIEELFVEEDVHNSLDDTTQNVDTTNLMCEESLPNQDSVINSVVPDKNFGNLVGKFFLIKKSDFKKLNESTDNQVVVDAYKATGENSSVMPLQISNSGIQSVNLIVASSTETSKIPKRRRYKRKKPPGYVYRCRVCKKTFNTFEELKAHRAEMQHSKRRKPLGYVFRCKKCSKGFSTFSELQKHKKEAQHPIIQRMYPCELCGRVFTNSRLKLHLRAHTQERPFKCEYCDLTFTLKGNLTRHAMIHTGERPYVCEMCGQSFIQSGSLHSHQERVHSVEYKPKNPLQYHVCNICGAEFDRVSTFQKHLRIHDPMMEVDTAIASLQEEMDNVSSPQSRLNLMRRKADANQVYTCTVCGKTLDSKMKLRLHVRATHEKPHICSYCGKPFGTKKGLVIHVRRHTGEKPYVCEICGKGFPQKPNYDAHMRVHTGVKPFKCNVCSKAFKQRGQLYYHSIIHSGQRPHSCPYCGKTFVLKGNLTVHIRMHTGETPYLCKYCGKGFYDSSSRNKHQLSHDVKREVISEESSSGESSSSSR